MPSFHGIRTGGLILLAAGLFAATSSAQSSAPSLTTAPWPLTDALGRSAPMAGKVPAPRGDRFVGIFYFLWHNNRGGASPDGGPYDIAKILARDPDALKHPESPLWGPFGLYHYWGEPLYGYYLADDPWVIRRHARLLVDAGVDTLIFDTTNVVTYPEVYTRIGEVFTAIRQEGGRTPSFAFMVNTRAGETAQNLYKDLYQPGRFRDLWFQWQGKPLLICDPKEASPEVRDFFTLRRAHWPFTMEDTKDAWHWEATYPQPYGYTDDPKKAEQVVVSTAQNLRASDGKVTNMSNGDARGRSFHDGVQDRTPGAVLHGYNVQEQWKRAFELDPPFVMVTGWNEWIAGRFGKRGRIDFVDQYDQEFSRDIEPMRGGHGDNYYAQLVANVRRYKGVPPVPAASAPKTIPIDGPANLWDDVAPAFDDDLNDNLPRDHEGAGGTHYVNRTGRNDLVLMKVARDAANVSFLARAREPIVPGLWLLIDADQDPKTGWEGYDFIAGRITEGDAPVLERNTGGWTWARVGTLPARSNGTDLTLSIPREALGMEGTWPVRFDFKWVDNAQKPGDVMDFYVSGDVAPEGRMRFRYVGDR
ncbi:hypothetical protein TA3x_001401 [Tundrisphaera sp. TA3]|uniref:hypothetical protein n=1 Tax=Tundrisphaera sp. TA3 TaxID=3435775 RepID=UPI003EC12725